MFLPKWRLSGFKGESHLQVFLFVRLQKINKLKN